MRPRNTRPANPNKEKKRIPVKEVPQQKKEGGKEEGKLVPKKGGDSFFGVSRRRFSFMSMLLAEKTEKVAQGGVPKQT